MKLVLCLFIIIAVVFAIGQEYAIVGIVTLCGVLCYIGHKWGAI